LPDQAYTKFGACKSTHPEESKSSQRLRKVSYDSEPREGPKSCDGVKVKEECKCNKLL